MKEFMLPYGKEKLTAKIEDEHLAGVLVSELHSYKAPKSGAELVQESLEHPIGTPRLCDMAVGKKKIVVISSDHTRPCLLYTSASASGCGSGRTAYHEL